MTIKLRTTMTHFEAMHAAVAKLKRGTAKVTVSAEALAALLSDHSQLNAALRGETIEETK